MIEPLSRWSEILWTGMAVHLWQTTLVLALLAVAARWMRDAPGRWLAAFWWLAVIKLFLPLQLLAPLTRGAFERWFTTDPAGQTSGGGASVITVWFYPAALQGAGGPDLGPSAVFFWLSLAWVAGVAFLLLLPRLRGRPQPDAECPTVGRNLRDKLDRAARRAGISGEAIEIVGRSSLPAVRGLLRPRIIVPLRVVDGLNEDELLAILLHEETHRRRRDPLRAVALRAAAVGFFFYPPVWWLLRRVREATEMACDEAVLGAGVRAADYRRSLARTLTLRLEPVSNATAIFGVSRSPIIMRLRRLSRSGRFTVMRRHRLALTVALAAVVAASFLPLTPRAVGEMSPAKHGAASFAELDRLADKDLPVLLHFQEVRAELVLQALAKVGPLELHVDGAPLDMIVSIDAGQVTLKEALIQLAGLAGLRYEVTGPQTLRVSRRAVVAGVGGVDNPRLIEEFKVDPQYPEEARAARIDGNVILQAVIDRNGEVAEIEVLRTNQPDYPFAESAIEAVRQWRYEPATLDGEPVDVYFTVFVEFKLHD